MGKMYNINLNQDQMVTLANLLVTLDCNQDELKKMPDGPSDGMVTVWDCLEAPIEVLEGIVENFVEE